MKEKSIADITIKIFSYMKPSISMKIMQQSEVCASLSLTGVASRYDGHLLCGRIYAGEDLKIDESLVIILFH